MSAYATHLPGAPGGETADLIETMLENMQRLEDLTAGEVDSVTDSHGRTLLLRRSQEHLRHSEAAKQAAILNALPAHIALLDAGGIIVSVNEAWRRFAQDNALQGRAYAIGVNYLDICDRVLGDDAGDARQVARGLHAVLEGRAKNFSLEYPCHSPTEQRWFMMNVTPLAGTHANGAVVMHLDITARKQAESRIKGLNRMYAMASGINSLQVRVRNRQELFDGACRTAVDAGGFPAAWIGMVDQDRMKIMPMASAGLDPVFFAALKTRFSSSEASAWGDTLTEQAVKEKKPIVANHSQANTRIVFGEWYARSGVHSLAILPLVVADVAVGVLVLCASTAEFFHAKELALVTELADDIAFGIDHLEKQDRLDYLAYYDALTGVANRNLFLERVGQHLRRAADGGRTLAVCLVDVERFKNINDSLGRATGDELLQQIVAWLTRTVGDASLLARVGADQFALVRPQGAPHDELPALIETGLHAFLLHPFQLNGEEFQITFKVGIALFPENGADAETLLKNAEAALKKAKASGARYLFYNRRMTEAVASKLALENRLRQALDRGEFVLHYQPKVSLATGLLTSAEALIRWNDPRSGLVPPAQFIPVLEETGLIHDVGRWALHQAIADYLRWRDAGLAVVRIAVNVSPLQLRHRDFVAEVRQALALDALAARGLELEITESLIMEDVKHSIDSLQAIRALGVSIAIDDFGTGFSSLSYLAKLPVDSLKIDRSFVIDMTTGPQGLALVSTIINLAHALKLKVVAEGVETEQQARLLRLLACDDMQGYLFSKPLPGAIFEARHLRLPALNR